MRTLAQPRRRALGRGHGPRARRSSTRPPRSRWPARVRRGSTARRPSSSRAARAGPRCGPDLRRSGARCSRRCATRSSAHRDELLDLAVSERRQHAQRRQVRRGRRHLHALGLRRARHGRWATRRVLADGEGITLGRSPALPRPAHRGAAARAWPSTSTRSTSPPGASPRRRRGAARRHAGGHQARDQLRPRRPPHRGDPGREGRCCPRARSRCWWAAWATCSSTSGRRTWWPSRARARPGSRSARCPR